MNAIVPDSTIALAQPRWTERVAALLRAWATQPDAKSQPDFDFGGAEEVIRKARADQAATICKALL